MSQVKPEELWFNTPDSPTLCRAGGNGPQHPSQMYAIDKYVVPMFEPSRTVSFLDYGCGSATTFEAITKNIDNWKDKLYYRGLDIIPKNIEWCKENYPDGEWAVNSTIHRIDEADKSYDVVYSRHVVDHMNSFEEAMDEHCRVAKELVIVVLWTGLLDGDNHEIKNIVDQRGLPTEKLYPNEYTNNYSKKKVLEYLNNKEGWELLELTENVGAEVKGCDVVLCLKRS